jgi:CRP-like cAMP-binding protein
MYIIKEGILKRYLNGICIGNYEKGQSLEEYAVISRDCLRKETLVAGTDCEVIALSIDQIEEALGKSLPIIILRNKVKN